MAVSRTAGEEVNAEAKTESPLQAISSVGIAILSNLLQAYPNIVITPLYGWENRSGDLVPCIKYSKIKEHPYSILRIPKF